MPIVLSGKDMEWDKLETYLTMDRKKYSKKHNLEAFHSRFNILQKYFLDKPFNRETFLIFLSECKQRGLAPSSLNNYIKVAKHINKLYQLHELDEFSYFDEPIREIIPLSAQEVDKLSKVSLPYQRCADERNHRDYIAIQFLFNTGSRISDLKYLMWEDVRSDPIPHVVFRDINTKNGERHEMAVTERVYKLLLSMPKYGVRVFDSRNGKVFERSEFNKNLKRRMELTGINKKIHTHIFRHSRATQLGAMGFSDGSIAQFLNQKDVNTTKRYIHRGLFDTQLMAYASPLEQKSAYMNLLELGQQALQRIYDKDLFKIVADIVDGNPIWKAIPLK